MKVYHKDGDDLVKSFKRDNEQNRRGKKIGDRYFSYEAILEYLEKASGYTKKTDITIAKIIPFDNINKHLEEQGKDWKEMSQRDKNKLLYSAGLAVMKDKENEEVNSRYEVREMYYRGEDNKTKYGMCVVGSERIDKEWLQSGYASDEAKLYDSDATMRDQLRNMQKSELWGCIVK